MKSEWELTRASSRYSTILSPSHTINSTSSDKVEDTGWQRSDLLQYKYCSVCSLQPLCLRGVLYCFRSMSCIGTSGVCTSFRGRGITTLKCDRLEP